MTELANQNPEQIARDIIYDAGFRHWQKCTIKKSIPIKQIKHKLRT